jgi:RIO-like serine/threonine protein kinase
VSRNTRPFQRHIVTVAQRSLIDTDIYRAQIPPTNEDELPVSAVLKVHRLGRISFRKIKEKRDYLGKRKSAPNWMYLSRLAAKKEWQFLQVSRSD